MYREGLKEKEGTSMETRGGHQQEYNIWKKGMEKAEGKKR